ncbi:GntR family transcriptional regulator [Rhodococcus sp. 1R11]|uniref:GntR family transcriptional regulator n=1 Tax=Rhodococcus sp. 1R11 TaxID=2559614 RepID=UPI0010728E32|nr:GntR family transcriptional regulator [Rhodococcus sp. 1R11]TFI42505.1 GntR family transcriptional regulator [Rhodococcus sp. 1R11]
MWLSEDDRRSLVHIERSRRTTQEQAQRARIVLLSETNNAAWVGRELGVTTATVRKWCARYEAGGAAALADLPRTGRPATTSAGMNDSIQRLMLSPPPASGWTTRAIAEALEISQTAASRALRRSFTWPPDRPPHPLSIVEGPLVLARVVVDLPLRLLVFHEPATPLVSWRKGSPDRPRAVAESIRTTLSAHHALNLSGIASTDLTQRMRDNVDGLDADIPQGRTARVLVDAAAPPALLRGLERSVRFEIHTVPTDLWVAQVEAILALLDPRQSSELLVLEARVREWAIDPAAAFAWRRLARSARNTPRSDRQSTDHPPPFSASVLEALRASITSGEFQAGQRIAETPLARRLGVSRGPIRDALNILAEDGLVELEPHRGAYIPIPTRTDVYDTYTARGPLGALLFRRLASGDVGRLKPLEAGLADIVEYARAGDIAGAGEADIRWQDTAAALANAPRIEKMFARLSLQLRMFLSILGLDYAYAAGDIVEENSALLRAMQDRDSDEVTQLWRRKVDKAVAYMVEQLAELDME